MARTLIIETSGRLGSVAVSQGPQLLAEQAFTEELRHTSQLFPTIENLCRAQSWVPSDIEHLYVSAGPGSFTGLRIAITAAKTLAFAQSTRIVAVPSMEAMALNAVTAEKTEKLDIRHLAVVLEAGRGQVFAAVLEKEQFDPEREPPCPDDRPGQLVPGFRLRMAQTMLNPSELLAKSQRPLFLLGEGLKYHPEDFSKDPENIIRLDEKYWRPRARYVHRCGWLGEQAGLFTDADKLEPIYLRRPEAAEKWEQLHGKK